jgi:hypothetical protein
MATRLINAALDVRDLLDTSEAVGMSRGDVDSLHARLGPAVESLVQEATEAPFDQARTLYDLWNWAIRVRDSIRDSSSTIPDADLRQVERDHEVLSRLYPGAADLARQLADLRLGKVFLWSNDREGATLVRLSVKSRLGTEYHPARETTGAAAGLNILRVRPRVPWFQASAGLTFTPLSRRTTFSDRVSDGTTFFDERERDRLTPVPSTYFGVQFPVGRSAFVLGGGIGVGVRIGSGDLSLRDAIDYSVFLTGGYEWFRVHIGGVWSAEVDKATLPAERANGIRFEHSTRRLADLGTTRHWYWLFLGIAKTL